MAAPPGKVLLIGWDAADWKIIRPLLERGCMPHLKSLIDGGVAGNVTSLQPMLSPMLWTSIATGKRPDRHGIHGFTEPRPDGEGIRAVASTSRTCKAIWNILSQTGRRTHCVNWYASHPAEPINGVSVSNRFAVIPPGPGLAWPIAEGAVHPTDVCDALAPVRVRPEELDASMLLPFVPDAAKVDQARDKRLLALAVILAEAATTHGAITWCVEHRPWDFAAVLYNGIDQFCHLFMQYHPPRRDGVSEEDFALYHGVVAAAYRFHDMMLGRLIELAGADATIMLVSDHGYRIDRAAAAAAHEGPRTLESLSREHRAQGICVLRGPRVQRGQTLQGASLLDVTPTLLALMSVPIGADMDGRPWVEFLHLDAAPESVISWETIDAGEPSAGQHPPALRESPAESLEAVRHLIELGYVDPPEDDVRRAIERTLEQNKYNLARSLMDARQPTHAIALFEELLRRHPEHVGYATSLFEAHFSVGRISDARRVAETMWSRGYRGPLVNLALGAVAIAQRRIDTALEYLKDAERATPDQPSVYVLIGRAYLRLQEWKQAQRAFETALQLDGDSETAWDGLASAQLGRGDAARAAEHALHAVGLRSDYPEGHYHLGVALAQLGRAQEAAEALRRCLSIQPHMLAAYGRLIDLYEGPLLDHAAARRCRQQTQQIMLERRLRRRAPAAPSTTPAASATSSPPDGHPPAG